MASPKTPTSNHLLHVVAVPYPAQGHLNPMLQLCEQLAPLGFSFTFINTHHIHHRLLRAGQISSTPAHAHPRQNDATATDHCIDACNRVHVDENCANGVRNCRTDDAHVRTDDGDVSRAHGIAHAYYKGHSSIRMVFVEGGCAPEQHAHVATSMDAFKAAQEMREPVERLFSQLTEEQAVDFIMSDLLLGWSSDTAHKFGLPWVCFWAASAATFSALIYFSDFANLEDACIPAAEMDDEEAPPIEGIPGLPPMSRCDVPKMWDAQGKVYHQVCKQFKEVDQAFVVLLNTCEQLEGQVLEALSKRFPIQAVGPLLPSRYMQVRTCPDNEGEGAFGRLSLFTEDRSCLAWLSMQAPSSVLFISFGSISLRSNEQLQELVKGVEASGCPFLFVCKPDIFDGLDNNLKHSFATPKDGIPHGLVVPWVPQLQVLSHPSVGGFVTHCGWNSIIESVSMGVPMLCWADTSERRSNQRFVVEFWKCGLDMVADRRRAKQHIDEAVLVGREDIEKSIRLLMLEEGGASIRVHSMKVREATIKSYQGSQDQLSKFAKIMEQRCHHVGGNGNDNY